MAAGWDPAYGARLCSDLRAAGLLDVHADYTSSSGPGGSLAARLLSLTLERARPGMLALGANDFEIDDARRLLEAPTTTFESPTTCAAHGRRPG